MQPWWPSVEPTPRWVRVRLGGELVADSRRALLHIAYGPGDLPRSFLPTYYVPVEDLRPGVLGADEAGGRLRDDDLDGGGWWPPGGGRRLDAPVASSPARGPGRHGHVLVARADRFEEDEPLMAHAKTRTNGWTSHPASATSGSTGRAPADREHPPTLLFETTLPVRYYLPREDIVAELLPTPPHRSAPTRSRVVVVGSRRGPGHGGPRVELSDPDRREPAHRRADVFFNEKVDLVVDGERQERPVTPWS